MSVLFEAHDIVSANIIINYLLQTVYAEICSKPHQTTLCAVRRASPLSSCHQHIPLIYKVCGIKSAKSLKVSLAQSTVLLPSASNSRRMLLRISFASRLSFARFLMFRRLPRASVIVVRAYQVPCLS
jgi:hypothetical protein